MKILYSTMLILIVSCIPVRAQQFQILDQYLVNPFALSPSFAGKDVIIRSLVTHRSEWTGLSGHPVVGNLNIDGTIVRNMGLGASLVLNKAGIYRNFCFSLAYAYHLKLATDHYLSFGINPAIYQNSIDFTDLLVSDPDDPMIKGRDGMSETYLNVGFGLLYNWKNLNVSVSFPILFNNRSFYYNDDYQHLLTMERNWLVYMGYIQPLPSDFSLKFDVLFRYNQFNPWTIDLSFAGRYQDSYWLGILYRKGNIIGITAGIAIIHSILIQYTYEFSGTAMMGKSSGTHEISLGYILKGKSKPKKEETPQLKDYTH